MRRNIITATNILSAAEAVFPFGAGNLTFGAITVCSILLLMLFANILRRKIPFLRRSLLPTAVIAGLLGLVIKEIVKAAFDFDIFHITTLKDIVFHFLSVGFIALCLRDKDDYAYEEDKAKVKRERVGAFKSGSMIVSTYLMQGIVGLAVTILLCYTFIPQLNAGTGLILPLGFGQGPNQASNTGSMWDTNGIFAAFGEGSGQNFGITIAAFGFLWASIPGVFIVNRIAKKRGLKLVRNDFPKSGDVFNHKVEESNEIPLSESIDKFTLQICMVGAVYLVTIGIIIGLEALFRLSNVKFLLDLIPTIWGFSFMISVLMALLVKKIMKTLFRKGVMHRKYPNSYMMNRISGAAFDISITAALCIISLMALGKLWIPVLIMTTVGGFATIFFCKFFCDRLYKDYKDEAFLGMYGMLTGTISNGMILIREIDNEFSTPAADDLVAGSSTGIILGFPLLLLIGIATTGLNWLYVLIIITAYMFALIGYMMNWHKKLFGKIFKGAGNKRKHGNDEAVISSNISPDIPEDENAPSDQN